MQATVNDFRVVLMALIVSSSMYGTVNAQTPADDPGIGGPGIGAAPAGDGSPIVPFDGNMNLALCTLGIVLACNNIKQFDIMNGFKTK